MALTKFAECAECTWWSVNGDGTERSCVCMGEVSYDKTVVLNSSAMYMCLNFCVNQVGFFEFCSGVNENLPIPPFL